ncbi:MAG: hypothetical protein AAB909_00670 [Patescibacteria group bacterium]
MSTDNPATPEIVDSLALKYVEADALAQTGGGWFEKALSKFLGEAVQGAAKEAGVSPWEAIHKAAEQKIVESEEAMQKGL